MFVQIGKIHVNLLMMTSIEEVEHGYELFQGRNSYITAIARPPLEELTDGDESVMVESTEGPDFDYYMESKLAVDKIRAFLGGPPVKPPRKPRKPKIAILPE